MLKKLVVTALFLASAAFAGSCCKGPMQQGQGMGMACDTNMTAPGCKLGKDCPCGPNCKCGVNCKCATPKKSKKTQACVAPKTANACQMNANGCMSMATLPRFMMVELQPTKAQEAKLAEISKNYSTKMSEAAKGCQIKPLSFIKDGKFDKEAFMAKHNEATANMAKLKADMFEEVFAVLDDKQKKELSDIVNFKK